MNWDALGAIGELVGAVAVVGSVVYIASQIRVAARVAKSQSQRDVYEEFNTIIARCWASPEASDLMWRGIHDLYSLSMPERGTFHGCAAQLLNHYLMVTRMHESGFADDQLMETFTVNIVSFLRAPGGNAIWLALADMYPELNTLKALVEDDAYEAAPITDLPYLAQSS